MTSRELDRTERRDLVLGVVLPALLVGPLLALGLVGILVIAVASPRSVPPESRDFIAIAFAAGMIGFTFLGFLARVIWVGRTKFAGAGRIGSSPPSPSDSVRSRRPGRWPPRRRDSPNRSAIQRTRSDCCFTFPR